MALRGLPFVASKTLVMSKFCVSHVHMLEHTFPTPSKFFLSPTPIATLQTSASNLRRTKGKCHSCVSSRCAIANYHLSLSQSSILMKWYVAVELFFTLLGEQTNKSGNQTHSFQLRSQLVSQCQLSVCPTQLMLKKAYM